MKTKIITLVKNEQEYLEEWINYHLQLGFDKIEIYEDFGSTTHFDITQKYEKVQLSRIDNVIKQINDDGTASRYGKLLEHCIAKSKEEYDWLLCIDVDEYLMLEDSLNLHDFLNNYKDVYAISLFWKFMSANGKIHKCKDIVKTYTKESEKRAEFYHECKNFFNLKKECQLQKFHCHHCAVFTVNTLKQFVIPTNKKSLKIITYKYAWINHYITKSWEDWCDRIYKRGNLTVGIRRLLDFFTFNKDMTHLQNELVTPLYGIRPRNSVWLDNRNSILYTGQSNVSENAIKEINNIIAANGIFAAQEYIKSRCSLNT